MPCIRPCFRIIHHVYYASNRARLAVLTTLIFAYAQSEDFIVIVIISSVSSLVVPSRFHHLFLRLLLRHLRLFSAREG